MGKIKDNLAVAGFFMVLFLLSVWLQFGLLEESDNGISATEENDPDYYTENFVSTVIGENGKKYRIIADRLVHYPVGDSALLDNPHIIQYDLDQTLRHVYAESGWLYDNKSTVLLTGNVRVVQSQGRVAGGVASSEKMLIHLKDKNDRG